MDRLLRDTVAMPTEIGSAIDTYRMIIDLNVLDHLGINLYSNIAAVLTEAVANAWDADAGIVDIEIDLAGDEIVISDDGVGMTIEDMNRKYLRVGYRRRKEDAEFGRCTAKGRQVMGCKGLGKLSLFSIAEQIEVQSCKDGQAHGLRMSAQGVRQSVERNEPCYRPESLPEGEVAVAKGTRILLRAIKRKRLKPGVTALRKRLARRFSVIGERDGFDGQKDSFKVVVNGQPITADDRDDLAKVQFLWTVGEPRLDSSSKAKCLETEQLSSRCEGWPEGWNVRGWIGTASRPKQLDSEDAGNLNGIVVLARGRLFHENILEKVNNGNLFTKYLTGQIEADFLDQDDKPDIATSDRQRVQEDDDRYVALLSFLKASLAQVERRWTEWRVNHEIRGKSETSAALVEWLGSLPEGFRGSAKELIGRLGALPIDNEDDRRLLYRHGIWAFERMRLRGSVEKLVRGIYDVDKILPVLADRDDLEASLYRDIVRSRLEAIRSLQGLVNENEKEKALQEYLFDHLWLLDPAWERATGSESMESALVKEGVIVQDLTKRERLGRVDIAYRTNAGRHIVVELKRADRKLKLWDLVEQGQGYVDKLRKVLLQQGENSPDIEVIFVIGKPVDEESSNPSRLKSSMDSVSQGSRIVHYDGLIRGAENAYSEYLEKGKESDRLEKIVDRIR